MNVEIQEAPKPCPVGTLDNGTVFQRRGEMWLCLGPSGSDGMLCYCFAARQHTTLGPKEEVLPVRSARVIINI